MRHRNKVQKLGRNASHRKAMMKNMALAVIEHGSIKTTLTKAKALQGYMDKLITYGKNDTVHSRRLAFRHLQSRDSVRVLFDEVATNYDDRKGGYSRVIKLGPRRGDGAEMVLFQLLGFEKNIIDEGAQKRKSSGKAPKKPAKSRAKAAAASVAAAAGGAVEAAKDAAEEAVEAVEEVVADAAEAVEEAVEAVEEKAEEVVEAAEEAVEEATDSEDAADAGEQEDEKKD